MPSHKELKAAANNLLCSFISRNNDIDGYWALGKLHEHALKNQLLSVDIDFFNLTISPPGQTFKDMVNRYADFFWQALSRRHIPPDWVKGLTLRLDFRLSPTEPALFRCLGRGEAYAAVVKVLDNRGREHVMKRAGWCARHDPALESRSLRS